MTKMDLKRARRVIKYLNSYSRFIVLTAVVYILGSSEATQADLDRVFGVGENGSTNDGKKARKPSKKSVGKHTK